MKFLTLALITFVALAAAFAAPAFAQQMQISPPCVTPFVPREAVVKVLKDNYDEAQEAGGVLLKDGQPMAIFELFKEAEGDTWTILLSLPIGLSCIIAGGEDWKAATPPEPGDPA